MSDRRSSPLVLFAGAKLILFFGLAKFFAVFFQFTIPAGIAVWFQYFVDMPYSVAYRTGYDGYDQKKIVIGLQVAHRFFTTSVS